MHSICIDIGNTNTKVGLFENEVLVAVHKGLTDTELLKFCNDLPDHLIITSTVTADFQHVYNLLNNKERLRILDHSLKIPIQNLYKTPHTLGTDRLAAAVGGTSVMPDRDLLIIQSGTCFTYDFVDSSKNYMGGGISPGLIMRFQALKEFTSRLPEVEMDLEFDMLIGGNTEESIKSGVINGCISELEGIIDRYVLKYPNIQIILTGGWANYFESKINRSKFAFHDLVLIGLNKILIHNNV
jgi:type III pantothenate kinase